MNQIEILDLKEAQGTPQTDEIASAMKVGFYGKVSARQQVLLDKLNEAGWEVVMLEEKETFDRGSFDCVFIDECKSFEDTSWHAMVEPKIPQKPYWRQKERY